MKKRFTIRLEGEELEYILQSDNYSETIKTAIRMLMRDEGTIKKQISEKEAEIKHKEISLVEDKSELSKLEKLLENTQNLKEFRPDGYEDSIHILMNQKERGTFNTNSLSYQARRLGLSLDSFKQKLFDDGYYDDLLRI